jgi:hypothetical protein
MGTLISYSFRGVPVQDRRCGPLASKPTLTTRNPRIRFAPCTLLPFFEPS